MEQKIFDFVSDIARKKGEEITMTTDLFSNRILDSLEIISLLSFLQDEFSVSFSPEDLQFENYQTVERIIDWARGRIK